MEKDCWHYLNDNHSYDVTVRIEIPPKNFNDDVKEDLV